MKFIGKLTPTLAAVAVSSVLAGGTGAFAATTLVHTDDIANRAVTAPKIASGAVNQSKLTDTTRQELAQTKVNTKAISALGSQVANIPAGPQGPKGDTGPAGADGLDGAIYRVANYTDGGDGWATVSCGDDETTSQKYTAISGGVQGYSDSTNPSAALQVTSSFPGRMDWSTFTPKPDRLDGWVVGLTGGQDTTLKVWALCVPNNEIQTQTTNY